ncbi:LPS export ABC transporter periplasmic protein LptC [Verminephrobacter aporrectodeae]|uniref:LPS export ABC transporter periplasmic protein LptC n=1 Tax=Verminephrobacter aporrectodeae TaxID=1110389 RepID=UPI0002376F7B|nr:LPS export ABC transporter periplasmic protein LptC [Verminephrobacter aporrectodeae]MCW8166325.1 LPS export ABC transporter periplasmic protein LptC [Verminephrobacter aporrectodeae subsp. tuberculatae]MCW8167936.1 LPS export ABC transporter periplasmic protein LptC [Verminephrobacter aporrectodeae subsp. tuberculatae]MCW8174784.1 LPS export ABC transporter periplasmic protein LptC [Verminephrobacter aporrectodeae subsp. tuberculatae]MCW8202244.1 LPS export ABC transporter periplasmic prote
MNQARARWTDGLRVIRQGWEQLTLYLPVALMGLLALGSWWLVRNAPQPLQLAEERQWEHQPDYSMKSFSMKSFDAVGRLQNEMQGEEARHYPDTDRIEIDRVRMRSIDPEGRVTVATADRALTNADGSEVQLFGHAVVTREPLPARPGVSAQPRLELRSEFLHAFTRTGRLRSNRPVTLTRDQDRFTADGMEYDNLDQVLQLHGRVRGLLPSPGAAQ